MQEIYTYITTYLINYDDTSLRYKADLYLCSHGEYYTCLGSKEFAVSKYYLNQSDFDIADIITDCHNSLLEETFRRLRIGCERDGVSKHQIKEDCKKICKKGMGSV